MNIYRLYNVRIRVEKFKKGITYILCCGSKKGNHKNTSTLPVKLPNQYRVPIEELQLDSNIVVMIDVINCDIVA